MTKETQAYSPAPRFWREISFFLPILPIFHPPQIWSLRKHSLWRIYLGGCLGSSIPGFPSAHQMRDWHKERTTKHKKKNESKKNPHDMREDVSQKKKERKNWMEGRKRKLPEPHLHILHIHFHFYRSVIHLGCLYRHMRIHVYLRRFGYRDPHQMRICVFHKGQEVVGKGM